MLRVFFQRKRFAAVGENVDGGAHEETQMTLREVVHDGPEEWVLFVNSDDVGQLALHLEVGEVREGSSSFRGFAASRILTNS